MARRITPMTPDLGGVENAIRSFEASSEWRVSIPGRIVIQQFFVSLGLDRIGFAKEMSTLARNQAIQTASSKLPEFLQSLSVKAASSIVSDAGVWDTKVSPTKEIGLLLIVQHINSWV
jgi:hypothetical protein